MLISAEAQGVFLDALRGGASLKAAAEAAGFSLSAFYYRRKADPDFDEAWDEAVEESAWSFDTGSRQARPLPSMSGGRLRKRRRLRLKGVRREVFLEALAEACNTKEAARAAGVDRTTVYRLIRRDRGFGRDNDAALARGFDRLEEAALREREARAARWRAREIVPAGEMTRDFDEQMRLLKRHYRPPPKPYDRYRARRPGLAGSELAEALIVRLKKTFGSK